MKGTRLINRFSEKNSHLAKWAILGPKMMHPHNSGSAVRIIFKFRTIKEANRYMKMILMIFLKKKIFCLEQMDHFGPKNDASHNSGFTARIFFLIFPSEKGQ